MAAQATNAALSANGGTKGAPRGRPKMREPLAPETIMDRNVRRLLEQRIREFHPEVQITRNCLSMLEFSDRPLTEREKLNVLAMCRCYSPDFRRLALLNYVGYLEKRASNHIDLAATLHGFRQDPSTLINVFLNDCITNRANTELMRQAITASRNRAGRHRDDDEL